jgi:hypothetical protein
MGKPGQATGSSPARSFNFEEHMSEPEFDEDGYPTEETLKAIREWPTDDLPAMLTFCEKAWQYKDYVVHEGDTWEFHTGGWSGNESIIQAMDDNQLFWIRYWKSSERGGHYKFEPVY